MDKTAQFVFVTIIIRVGSPYFWNTTPRHWVKYSRRFETRRDRYDSSKRRQPIPQWHGAISKENGDLDYYDLKTYELVLL